ncbi:MAG: TolC family protein [Acidobacteriia bacterium]|nr:TolC family protein [Terriglobia bacterium]
MRIRFSRISGALALCAIVPAVAQNQPPQPSASEQRTLVPPVRPFVLPPRIGVLAEARISLDQALAMALMNNADIEASRIDQQEAEYNLIAAQGVFDPAFSGNSFWLKQITPIASSLGGSATGAVLNRQWQVDPALSGATPWFGGSYRTDFSNQRTFTDNTFVLLNPQFPTSLNLQYTQPLWRGLRYDSNRHSISVAKKNRSLTDQQFRLRVMTVADQTAQAYWELVYAYNNLQVQLEAVDIARQQDESNRRQEDQGLLAPIDIVAAQTQLANFEIAAYSAQTALTRAENTLKTLILADRQSPLWPSALIPSTPVNTAPPLTPLANAVADALKNRPEAASVKISGEINQDDTRYYRELSKPQVDVVASYNRAGLAGSQLPLGPNPFTAGFAPLIERLNALSDSAGLPPINLPSLGGGGAPPVLVGSYDQSLSNLWAGNFPTTEVQLRISLPIRNRTADANIGRSLAEGRRIQRQLQQVEQSIEADVRNAMQAVESAQLRREAARVARQSAEEQYNSEQRQFRAGTSTLFLVQQRQSTMITARSQERRAEADLGEAVETFDFSTASILREHNITLK